MNYQPMTPRKRLFFILSIACFGFMLVLYLISSWLAPPEKRDKLKFPTHNANPFSFDPTNSVPWQDDE